MRASRSPRHGRMMNEVILILYLAGTGMTAKPVDLVSVDAAPTHTPLCQLLGVCEFTGLIAPVLVDAACGSHV